MDSAYLHCDDDNYDGSCRYAVSGEEVSHHLVAAWEGLRVGATLHVCCTARGRQGWQDAEVRLPARGSTTLELKETSINWTQRSNWRFIYNS